MEIWVVWDRNYEQVVSVWNSVTKAQAEIDRLEEIGQNPESIESHCHLTACAFELNKPGQL